MLDALVDRALWALRTWLDSWSGIGHVAVGMHRQGYDLQLTQYDERGWRATFYTTGMEHSPTSATGTAWGAHAVAGDAAGGLGRHGRGHVLDPWHLRDDDEGRRGESGTAG